MEIQNKEKGFIIKNSLGKFNFKIISLKLTFQFFNL